MKRPAGQGKLTVPYTHLSTIPVTPLLHYCVAVARWLSRLPQRSALCLLVKSIYLVNVCTPSYSPPPYILHPNDINLVIVVRQS